MTARRCYSTRAKGKGNGAVTICECPSDVNDRKDLVDLERFELLTSSMP